MFFCIHLPSFMGLGRPGQVGPWVSSRRSGRQVGSHEPTLERSLRGNGPSGRLQEELHPDQASTPGRVLLAQPHGGLHHLGGHGLAGGELMIIGWDAIDAAATKPLEQSTDGGGGQTQGRSDLAGRLTLLPEPEHHLTDRHRNGTRHGQTSQKR